jgi:hypothetical protein
MKTLKLIPVGTLLLVLLSVATLPAQNSLPDPHNDSCWSSLAALRACQLQAYNQAEDYAQRCSSYPEYQCNDYYQPRAKSAAKPEAKTVSNTTAATPSSAADSSVTPDTNAQASNTK